MVRHRAVISALALVLTGCGDAPAPASRTWDLLDETHLRLWSAAEIADQGAVTLSESMIRLEAGEPMTGSVFSSWESVGLPKMGYEIAYEARRVEGSDFFAAVTFPVGSTHLTFVPGGWSGATTGLSNIDGQSAISNFTGSAQSYENGAWYRFRVEVKAETIKVWMDDRLIVNVATAAHSLDLRPGDIELCKPFGFASFGTTGEIRSVRLKTLGH